MKLTIPDLSLVVLIGPSGSGKSTFARRHFRPTEILSSDYFRGLVSDDENSQDATPDAFDVLKFVAAKRLAAGRLTVIDATNVQPESRKPLVALARDHDVLPVAVVLKLPEDVCHQRNKARPDRDFGPHVIRNQSQQLRRSLRGLQREGFRYVYVLESLEDVESAQFERQPLWNNRKDDHGPFDIIGDVHGCYDELLALLEKLGYDTTEPFRVAAPPGRKVVFVGDLVDRGPKVVEVLRLVQSMVLQGIALCVPGNHDVKLLKKLQGKNVQITHGLAETLAQLEAKTSPEDRGHIAQFIDSLVGHYVLDSGRLVVAHAGMKQQYIGRASARVREFALYGETTGETDEFGLPVRHNWAAEYRGPATVVYGHTPVPEADWLNRTINIDTGCVFGGKLTCLRWPERELVSVPARQTYAEPARPFLPPVLNDLPRFGHMVEGADYIERPGAYAVIRNDAGHVAVVQVGEACFLPGGGADPGESAATTLSRECREECGHDAEILRPLGQAIQYVTTRSGKHYAKHCSYFEARFVNGTACPPIESDHTLHWLPPEEASRCLMLEADVWALDQVLNPATTLSAQQQHDDVLDLEDVTGKRIIATRLSTSVTVREENAIAALEVMSRFAANPKWLIYLPPTMSPSETTTEPGLLEHPREAFTYYLNQGVGQVVCQEKHMGSRAVAIVCRDESAARKRFGTPAGESGILYTRTGRRFFDDRALEASLLDLLRQAATAAGWWDTFQSDWFCLDCELMPWSAKAQDLLRHQYAAVGSASRAALADVVSTLEQAADRHASSSSAPLHPSSFSLHPSINDLLTRQRDRLQMAGQYVDAYRRYCWPVRSVADLKLAPFHLLASEGRVHVDKDHVWHMEILASLARAAGPGCPLVATNYKLVDVTSTESQADGIAWWDDLTSRGGEGMVVKPLPFVVRGKRGLAQPAVKCRGREYLRIIYGPEYTTPAYLDRLRSRGLAAKRSLALREFALGVEALERFVRREPLRRVHECTFGVLALESEPVDPRL